MSEFSKTLTVNVYTIEATGATEGMWHMRPVEVPRCRALIQDGKYQCGSQAKHNEQFCGTHAAMLRKGKDVKTVTFDDEGAA